MFVKMTGKPYGETWFRKQGKYAFDFVLVKDLASDLTEEEANAVLEHSGFYLNMYGAERLEKEPA